MPLVLKEPYEPRTIRCVEVWSVDGWRVKVHGIAYRRPGPDAALWPRAKEVVRDLLREFGPTTNHYGLAFMGLHQGRGSNFVFGSWWADENELHHHVRVSYPADPLNFRALPNFNPIVCAWDLYVLAHERQAWLETMLRPAAGPDPEAYLARQLHATV